MAAPGAQAPVLTSEQLRAVGMIQCPVVGCRKKPDGFKSTSALRYHMQSHAPGAGGGDAAADEPPLAAPAAEMLPAPGAARGAAPAGAGPYHCPEPGCPFGPGKKTLKSVKTAMQHAKKHAAPGAEQFECERCSRKFALRYRLTEHSKTCGKKPFHCKCGLALGHKSSLKTHIAQWNKTAPGEHADATPPDAGAAAGGEQLVGGAAGDADADAAAAAELDAAVMAAAGVDADANGLNM